MAGSFVLNLAVTIHQWLPPDNLSQSTHHLGARPDIVVGMARRSFDQASIGDWTQYLKPGKWLFHFREIFSPKFRVTAGT